MEKQIEPDLKKEIKALAAKTGYSGCGMAAAEPFAEFSRALDEIARRFPETAELYAEMKDRADPRRNAPWVRSLVVCVRRYGKYEIPEGLADHIGRNYLFDRRFKECPEYDMPDKMTRGFEQMGLRVLRGGVPDRWAAARAGAARFGKNCFVFSEHGSWINIECWRVDAELQPDTPAVEAVCPEGCRECIRNCPTGALVEPFLMRMDRCIAYLTYRAPEPIPEDLWKRMGTWIYGCDVCQEVCPLNKGKWEPLERAPWQECVVSHLRPESLATMDIEVYRKLVHPRFWYISKGNPARWRANAARALAAMSGDDFSGPEEAQ